MGTLGNESFKQNCFIAVPFLRMRKEKSGKTRGQFPHECAEERYSTKKGISGFPFTGDAQGEQPGRTALGMWTCECQELVLLGDFVAHLFCLG